MRQFMLGALLLSSASSALAQDVVVMRRTVSEGVFGQHKWRIGDWVVTPGCSEKSPARRQVDCVNITSGEVVGDANCRGERQSSVSALPDFSTCSFTWSQISISDYLEACSDSTRRQVIYSCMRSGGNTTPTPVTSGCGPEPAQPASVSNYAGCSFAWAARSSTCDGAGTREFVYGCQRSGGTSKTAWLTDAASIAKCGTMPAVKQPDANCGPPNKLVNGDMEASQGWSLSGGAYVAGQGRNGSRALQVSYNAYGGGNNVQDVVLTEGKKYRLSVWAREGGSLNLYSPDAAPYEYSPGTSSTWARYDYVFTSRKSGLVSIYVRGGSWSPAYIDDVTLVELP